MIGPENSRHSRIELDAKLKPITIWSPALSRALGSLVKFEFKFSVVFRMQDNEVDM